VFSADFHRRIYTSGKSHSVNASNLSELGIPERRPRDQLPEASETGPWWCRVGVASQAPLFQMLGTGWGQGKPVQGSRWTIELPILDYQRNGGNNLFQSGRVHPAKLFCKPGRVHAPDLEGICGRVFFEPILLGWAHLNVPEVALEVLLPASKWRDEAYGKRPNRIGTDHNCWSRLLYLGSNRRVESHAPDIASRLMSRNCARGERV
jgi:hypothetical protein